jgi:RNA polymerase sigma factor (TIGR02999 family)
VEARQPLPEDVTQLLRSLRGGDNDAESRLMSLIYRELHDIAARLMRRERRDHTLQATALVNAAYVRLADRGAADWKDRAHFFGVAAQVMRHILIDHARQRLSHKRGAGVGALRLDEALVITPNRLEELLVLDDVLRKLEKEDPRASHVVVYRFFGGLTVEEIAEIMRVAPRTVKRDWNYARAWLKAELKPKATDVSSQPQPG